MPVGTEIMAQVSPMDEFGAVRKHQFQSTYAPRLRDEDDPEAGLLQGPNLIDDISMNDTKWIIVHVNREQATLTTRVRTVEFLQYIAQVTRFSHLANSCCEPFYINTTDVLGNKSHRASRKRRISGCKT